MVENVVNMRDDGIDCHSIWIGFKRMAEVGVEVEGEEEGK